MNLTITRVLAFIILFEAAPFHPIAGISQTAVDAKESSVDKDWNVLLLLQSLDVPKHLGHDDFPMVPTYLDMFTEEHLRKYRMPDGRADPGIREKLVELLLACRKISVRKQQDYFVPIQSPIMRLTSEFFPEVSKLPTEPDGGVSLSNVIGVIDRSKTTEVR
jgi:hypothetical protein